MKMRKFIHFFCQCTFYSVDRNCYKSTMKNNIIGFESTKRLWLVDNLSYFYRDGFTQTEIPVM